MAKQSRPTSTQQHQQQHQAALEQHSPRAALVLLLLRLFYSCILLEHELDEYHRQLNTWSYKDPVQKDESHPETKKKLPSMCVVDTACSHVLWPSSHEHTSTRQRQQQQHSAALEQHSIGAALVRLLLLLLYCCVPLEQHSSARAWVGFQAWPIEPRTKRTREQNHSIAQAQPARGKHKHGVDKQSRALSSSNNRSSSSTHGTRATLDSSSTRRLVVAAVSLLRTART